MEWPTTDAEIVALILQNEGGYVNLPSDRGGSTNFGITIDTLASWRKTTVTDADIQALSVEEASQIYLAKYITAPGFDQLTDIRLRAAIVDYGVLCGPVNATESLQVILGLSRDGICGPVTATAANNTVTPDIRAVINGLSVARISFHANRVAAKPDQLPFLVGWVSRATRFIE